jgi:hypothetical protein
MEKPSIDPQNISMWIVASVCIGLLALLLGAITLYELRATTLLTQGQLLLLNKKVEEVRKLAQGAAAPPATSSAPTQAPAQPAK